MLDWCFDAGFRRQRLTEPRPTGEALRNRPELLDASLVPYFIGLDLVRD